jgi:hypothetical protein
MWSALHALSKSYFYFIIGFSVYGAIATHQYDEILGPALVGLIWFPLWVSLTCSLTQVSGKVAKYGFG